MTDSSNTVSAGLRHGALEGQDLSLLSDGDILMVTSPKHGEWTGGEWPFVEVCAGMVDLRHPRFGIGAFFPSELTYVRRLAPDPAPECDACDGDRCVYVGSLCNPDPAPSATGERYVEHRDGDQWGTWDTAMKCRVGGLWNTKEQASAQRERIASLAASPSATETLGESAKFFANVKRPTGKEEDAARGGVTGDAIADAVILGFLHGVGRQPWDDMHDYIAVCATDFAKGKPGAREHLTRTAQPALGGEVARQMDILRRASEVPVPDEDHDFSIEKARRGAASWREIARNVVAAYDASHPPAPAPRES